MSWRLLLATSAMSSKNAMAVEPCPRLTAKGAIDAKWIGIGRKTFLAENIPGVLSLGADGVMAVQTLEHALSRRTSLRGHCN
jgi:hypothetical protein